MLQAGCTGANDATGGGGAGWCGVLRRGARTFCSLLSNLLAVFSPKYLPVHEGAAKDGWWQRLLESAGVLPCPGRVQDSTCELSVRHVASRVVSSAEVFHKSCSASGHFQNLTASQSLTSLTVPVAEEASYFQAPSCFIMQLRTIRTRGNAAPCCSTMYNTAP